MKQLFYLLSFLLFINNYQSNKHYSCGKITHIFKNNDINPEDVTQEKQNQLINLLNKNKHEKFSKKLEKLVHSLTKDKLMHNVTKNQNRK